MCVAIVKSRREEREKTCLQGFVRWCCGGCMLVYCTLDPFPLSSTSTCHCFVFVLHCDNAPRCHAPCCFEHLRFLSPTLSLPSHAHTHTHFDTEPTSACVSLLLLLPLLLLLLLSLWCTQPGLQQHWCRRSSGDCRGAEEQQHAADAGVSAVCVNLGWWMRLCLW